MIASQANIGDRVEITEPIIVWDGEKTLIGGSKGTIKRLAANGNSAAVEFDEQIVEITSAYEAGSCHGSCKEGYGKYVPWDKLKKVNSYNIGDTVFLTKTISGIPKGWKMTVIEFTRREYAPYVIGNGHTKLVVTESQISKQKPIQKLDIKSTQDKEWRDAGSFDRNYPLTPKESFKSSKPMLAASLLVLV